MPSPSRDTVIPAQSNAKLRRLSGDTIWTRSKVDRLSTGLSCPLKQLDYSRSQNIFGVRRCLYRWTRDQRPTCLLCVTAARFPCRSPPFRLLLAPGGEMDKLDVTFLV